MKIVRIFDLFGTPNENNWPDIKTLPDYVEFKPQYPKPLKIMFSAATNDVLNVLDSMLQLNPNKRCTCKEVLVYYKEMFIFLSELIFFFIYQRL